jgi:hypothetical protein
MLGVWSGRQGVSKPRFFDSSRPPSRRICIRRLRAVENGSRTSANLATYLAFDIEVLGVLCGAYIVLCIVNCSVNVQIEFE